MGHLRCTFWHPISRFHQKYSQITVNKHVLFTEQKIKWYFLASLCFYVSTNLTIPSPIPSFRLEVCTSDFWTTFGSEKHFISINERKTKSWMKSHSEGHRGPDGCLHSKHQSCWRIFKGECSHSIQAENERSTCTPLLWVFTTSSGEL